MNLVRRRRVGLALLKESWQECQRCGLAQTRRKIVFGSGVSPAALLIIGEAPGRTEDLLGMPFVGKSGVLLKTVIEEACAILKRDEPRIYITNIVACRPCDKRSGPNRKPTDYEALRCWPRLHGIILLVRPQRIVLLGRTAEERLIDTLPEAHCLQHPAYIVRGGGTASRRWTPYLSAWKKVIRGLT